MGNVMNLDGFTSKVQHHLELRDGGEGVRAIRATLMTLGQPISNRNAEDLATSIPMAVTWFLTEAVHEHRQHFDWNKFITCGSEIEGGQRPAHSPSGLRYYV